jgi:acetyl-CoA C-acetyltransferase
MSPTDVVIVAGARTPMARYTGAFSEVSGIDLAAHASKETIRRSGVDDSTRLALERLIEPFGFLALQS